MLVFSRSKAEQTGNTDALMYQFNCLQAERTQNAQAVADILGRTRGISDGSLSAINAIDDIKRLYRAYDQTVLREFEPNTEFALLNDIIPLSRSVRLEESVYEYAKIGGKGWAHTSMSGQIGAALDARVYAFDGTMVPIHDTGFKFAFRDPIFNKGSALQSLADAQQGSVADLRRQYVDYIFNGFRDSKGNFIKHDGKTWKGLNADERVAQVALTFNFVASTDPKAIRAEVIKLRDLVRVTNNQYSEQTWYVSSQIISNLEQYFDVNSIRTVLEELKKLTGIKDIKEDSQLDGNEIVIIPLGAGVVAPIVGQAIGTVADPRPLYNSDYVWRTWGAMGLMVKTDINGKFSVIHAKG